MKNPGRGAGIDAAKNASKREVEEREAPREERYEREERREREDRRDAVAENAATLSENMSAEARPSREERAEVVRSRRFRAGATQFLTSSSLTSTVGRTAPRQVSLAFKRRSSRVCRLEADSAFFASAYFDFAG